MADIEKMKKKLEEIKAKIKAAESRETKKKRAEETRRKILVGAIVLEEMRHDEKALNYYMKKLDQKLTRPQDRILFRLESKSATSATAESEQQQTKIQTKPQQQQKTDTTKSTTSAPTSAPAATTKTSEQKQKSKPAPDKK